MSLFHALLLGVLQGLTEFLPVSSSGHLVLAEALLGLDLPGVVFEVTVHVATLCAVLWVYRARVVELLRGLGRRDGASLRYVGLLLLASVPAGIAGTAGGAFFEGAFDRPVVAAAALLVTGGLVWSLKRTASFGRKPVPGAGSALGIGVAQAAAILPGLSRSGATVAVGSWLGVEVVRMAEFSFLLSVPAIAGAALLQADEVALASATLGVPALAAGFAAALVSGVAAIRIFVRMLETRRFHRFAYYCWVVGLAYLAAAALSPGLR